MSKSSSKAGISWPVQELTSDPLTKFFQSESRLSWFYNWNKRYDQAILPRTSQGLVLDADFVPMIFSSSHLDNGIPLQEGWEYLLGFNEPDMQDQSVAVEQNPEEAAESWVKLAELKTYGDCKLVSPAVSHDKEWLKRFLSLLPDKAKPDYLAIHIYTTTFESLKAQVEDYWSTFRLPIFITEFAMTSFDSQVPPPADQQQVHNFMGQVTKWLDETDYIVRYAWFGACRDPTNLHGVHPYNRLMDNDGDLTPLGYQYINGGHD